MLTSNNTEDIRSVSDEQYTNNTIVVYTSYIHIHIYSTYIYYITLLYSPISCLTIGTCHLDDVDSVLCSNLVGDVSNIDGNVNNNVNNNNSYISNIHHDSENTNDTNITNNIINLNNIANR